MKIIKNERFRKWYSALRGMVLDDLLSLIADWEDGFDFRDTGVNLVYRELNDQESELIAAANSVGLLISSPFGDYSVAWDEVADVELLAVHEAVEQLTKEDKNG